MPPTLISRDRKAIEAFREMHGEVVMKPLYGHGGAAVFKLGPKDPNFGSLYDMFAATFRRTLSSSASCTGGPQPRRQADHSRRWRRFGRGEQGSRR